MMAKYILGLDLGTNSIGWALIQQNFENKTGKILGLGSRIIPMSQDILGEFDRGNSISQTASRTGFRGTRRLYERNHLRRERLHRVLNVLGFLPEHYADDIDFEKRFGKFKDETETKLPWKKDENGKFSFLFQTSFAEMLEDFKANGQDAKIPYDWTIYYLRKKALTDKITKEELAWLILNFNQKRGYYQLRGEEDEDATKTAKTRKYFDKQIIKSITDTNVVYKGLKVLVVELSNGNKGKIFKKEIPQWINTEKNIIATVDLDKDGNDKYEENGLLSQRFSIPTDAEWETEWKLIKLKTEKDLKVSEKTVGTYIYETLLQNPTQKIRGKLVRTIERKFYKEELKAILEKQIELQPELFTDELYNDCVRELYKNNEAHQLQLGKRDFVHLFLNDIIFYQRPLKSQKSSVGNCSLEFRTYKKKDENEKEIEITEYLKAIPKSNPFYQEFRVWQWLYNLKIYLKDDDSDVTSQFIKSDEDKENLFEFLMSKKEVNHNDILEYFIKPILKEKYPNAKPKAFDAELKKETAKYRWNYVYDSEKDESKTYPMNETGYEIRKRLEKTENVPADFLTREIEQQLWHIIYSVTDKNEFEKALETFAFKHHLNAVSFVENFKKFKPFSSEYGSFSEKAVKKLLPLLRIGKYWNWENIDPKTQARIDKILTGEFDEEIQNRVREKAIKLTDKNHFQGLQLWLASYVVYDRHSEANLAGKWNSVADLEKYLENFKQHSLRNPIVEQVITETLRVVKDIWTKYGNGEKDFFNEIHIELGREMKNTAEDRKRLTNIVTENENTNLRIKALIAELKNDSDIENVRPYSPIQQDILKIYEDGVLNSDIEIPDDILKISKTAQPTKVELIRYKLWLEQKYKSPYTGQPIPLSKLFTAEYEIEHVIPQSRYFDDSLSNKVICESVVNKKKDNQLGLEFIKNHSGEILQDGNKQFKVFTEDEYKEFVKEHYAKNKAKRTKLLLEEIPEKMIERQLNDTRYISKFVSQVLSNIVRAEKDDDGVNSKNLIPGNGKITSTLKQDWGLNDVWNELVLPRFERMNTLTNSEVFTSKNTNNKTIPTIPLELSKGFQKKRIDHRHHALDALVIACATRDHVNLLNNQSAKSDLKRYDLQHKLRNTEKWKDKDGKERDKFTEFKKPWDNFTKEAKDELSKIIVSFKQNLRVINKATNKYEKFENGKKIKVEQKGVNWAIRKPMHKDTISGKIDLPHINVPKGKILTATRKSIDTSFNLRTIESITDTGIQKILKNYLEIKGSPELAFSPEGLEEMNKNIAQYNDGKPHQPIYKARIFELGSKFQVGQKGNKKSKFVEAAKGTNLFFAVYERKDTKARMFDTIPLNEVIEHQKLQVSTNVEKSARTDIPIKNILEHNNKEVEVNYLFHLSPNDLVYVPIEDENVAMIDFDNLTKEQKGRIYKMVSSTGSECHFIHSNIASLIKSYDAKSKIGEFGSLNKLETTIDIENIVRIKEVCIKLKVDRLGNISKI
ncbi:MAG: HNH endonuclease domain-containing protein [Bergeyella sp.]